MKEKLKKIEIIFDLSYLTIVVIIGFLLFTSNRISPIIGISAFVLAFGDAFHLLPRVFNASTQAKGLGKAIASITMTLFYVFLCPIPVMIVLAAIRIFLCLLPQNQWLALKPPYHWGILRNVPLILMGIITCFFLGYPLWIPITISFACYIPVVLWAHKYPMLGMLMLPKSIAYVAILVLFLTHR
ncbi:hypothetical protein FACS189418_8720 [Clostridia bacterium]|nr:hypothetical protein FACS189418_8720 [Clostridia bacterium]